MKEIRIGTWNMQGCTIDGTNLLNTVFGLLNTVDILCLQECGVLQERESWLRVKGYPGLFMADLNAGTESRKRNLRIYHYPYGDNPRCSMAILVDLDLFSQDDIFPILIKGEGNVRPCVGVRCCEWGVFCVHAPSGNDAFARKTVYGFIDVIDKNLHDGVFEKVVIAGDFNTSPDQFKLSKGYECCYLIDDSGKMIPTHPSSDACYDYCIIKGAEPKDAGVMDSTSGLSDHLGVGFLFE